MSALERVARRIGMKWDDGGYPASEPYWYDAPDSVVDECDLRHYLLTGDRPLRVLEEYRMDCAPCSTNDRCAWCAMTAEGSVYAITPADAIIALAERIEGEG